MSPSSPPRQSEMGGLTAPRWVPRSTRWSLLETWSGSGILLRSFTGDCWKGADWLAFRGDRVNWKDHFVCSRDICLVARTVVMPSGGRTVFLDDAGDHPTHGCRDPQLRWKRVPAVEKLLASRSSAVLWNYPNTSRAAFSTGASRTQVPRTNGVGDATYRPTRREAGRPGGRTGEPNTFTSSQCL